MDVALRSRIGAAGARLANILHDAAFALCVAWFRWRRRRATRSGSRFRRVWPALMFAAIAAASLRWAGASTDAGHAVTATRVREVPPERHDTAAAPPPPWRRESHPFFRFSLDSALLAPLPAHHAVFSGPDGARDEILAWGALDAPAPATAIAVQTHDRAAAPEPFFVALARQAAREGVAVLRLEPAASAPTKFGEAETGEVKLAAEAASRDCMAFRVAPAATVGVIGWYCGPVQKPAERPSPACLLDRLDLQPGAVPELRRIFARAELARDACPASRMDAGRRRPPV